MINGPSENNHLSLEMKPTIFLRYRAIYFGLYIVIQILCAEICWRNMLDIFSETPTSLFRIFLWPGAANDIETVSGSIVATRLSAYFTVALPLDYLIVFVYCSAFNFTRSRERDRFGLIFGSTLVSLVLVVGAVREPGSHYSHGAIDVANHFNFVVALPLIVASGLVGVCVIGMNVIATLRRGTWK